MGKEIDGPLSQLLKISLIMWVKTKGKTGCHALFQSLVGIKVATASLSSFLQTDHLRPVQRFRAWRSRGSPPRVESSIRVSALGSILSISQPQKGHGMKWVGATSVAQSQLRDRSQRQRGNNYSPKVRVLTDHFVSRPWIEQNINAGRS